MIMQVYRRIIIINCPLIFQNSVPTRNFTNFLLKMDLNIYKKTTFASKMPPVEASTGGNAKRNLANFATFFLIVTLIIFLIKSGIFS